MAKVPNNEPGMNREDNPIPNNEIADSLPPVYGYPSDPSGGKTRPCWCCNCVECLFGGYLHPSTAAPFSYRRGDCFSGLALWKMGAYSGGQFDRKTVESLMARRAVPCDPSGNRTGVASMDLFVASSFDSQVNIPIRVFRKINPEVDDEKNSKTRVLFFIHGGGWCLGHPQGAAFHEMCESYAKCNFIVISVDYRLAPEHPFPSGLYDCYDVVRAVMLNKQFEQHRLFSKLDYSSVSFAGDSAGGNFSLVMATLVRDNLAADLTPLEWNLSLHKLILLYPGLMMDRFIKPEDAKADGNGLFLRKPVLEFFFASYVPGNTIQDKRKLCEVDRRLCPLLAGFHGLPRTLIIAGGLDYLRHSQIIAADVMKARGVDVTLTIYDRMPHGFLSFGKHPAAEKAFDSIIQELQRD